MARVHYYLSDHLNSTSEVVSSTGLIEEESDYFPFGTEVVVTGPGPNHYKFTGKERDAESGLDYFGARYYSNGLGRFISADWSATPIPVPYVDFGDPQSLNQYTYVRNIPTTMVDADGHDIWDSLKSIAVGTGNFAVSAGKSIAIASIPVYGPKVIADGIVSQVTVAAQEYSTKGVSGVGNELLDQGADGALEIVTEAVLNGAATAYSFKGTIENAAGTSGAPSGAVGGKTGVEEPEPAPYNRAEHYGNPATSKAATEIRASGEGKPCPSCGQTMKSGTKTAPTAEHNPTLKSHYYSKGNKMTPAQRRAYARSSESMDQAAVCKTCQSKQGAEESRK